MREFLSLFFFIICLSCLRAYDISDSQGNTYYKNIAVINVTPNGAVIMHSEGWAEISFGSLDQKVIEKLKNNAKEQFPNGLNITDINGNEYKKARVSCVEEDGITIEHSRGTTFVLFSDLPEEWRKTSGMAAKANVDSDLSEGDKSKKEVPKPINLDMGKEALKKCLTENRQSYNSCRKRILKLKKALNDYPKIYLKLIKDEGLSEEFKVYISEAKETEKNLKEKQKEYYEAKKIISSHVDFKDRKKVESRKGWRYETDPPEMIRKMADFPNRDKKRAVRYIYPEEESVLKKAEDKLDSNPIYNRLRDSIKELKEKKASLKEQFRKLRAKYKQQLKDDLKNSEKEIKKLKKEISKIKSKLSEDS